MTASMKSILFLVLLCCALSTAFLVPDRPCSLIRSSTTLLSAAAKKKAKRPAEAKGFGTAVPNSPKKSDSNSSSDSASPTTQQQQQQQSSTRIESIGSLQSVAGGSASVPVLQDQSDESQSPEERAERILREKYGMKTLEEQQLDAKQQEALKEKRRKMAEWRKTAAKEEEFDLMTTLPAPVIIGIDRFLKGGVVVTGLAFILAGLAITAEAWSKTTNTALPKDIDAFIVQNVEPNFTTGLFVLLGFSVSLGLFAAAQLGSQGAQYRED